MKTQKNNPSDRENKGAPLVLGSVNDATYICCTYCGLPMVKGNVAIWKENKDGKPYDANFLHYKCREPFEKTHKGKWFAKHMASIEIIR